jgi:hypothetical protein
MDKADRKQLKKDLAAAAKLDKREALREGTKPISASPPPPSSLSAAVAAADKGNNVNGNTEEEEKVGNRNQNRVAREWRRRAYKRFFADHTRHRVLYQVGEFLGEAKRRK